MHLAAVSGHGVSHCTVPRILGIEDPMVPLASPFLRQQETAARVWISVTSRAVLPALVSTTSALNK